MTPHSPVGYFQTELQLLMEDSLVSKIPPQKYFKFFHNSVITTKSYVIPDDYCSQNNQKLQIRFT